MSGRGKESHDVNKVAKKVAKEWPDLRVRGAAAKIIQNLHKSIDPSLFNIVLAEGAKVRSHLNTCKGGVVRAAESIGAEISQAAATDQEREDASEVLKAVKAMRDAEKSDKKIQAAVTAISIAEKIATKEPVSTVVRAAEETAKEASGALAELENIANKLIALFLLDNPLEKSPTAAQKWQQAICSLSTEDFKKVAPILTLEQIDCLVMSRKLTRKQAKVLGPFAAKKSSILADHLQHQAKDVTTMNDTEINDSDKDGLLLSEAQLAVLLAPVDGAAGPNTASVATESLANMTIGQIAAFLNNVTSPATAPTNLDDRAKALKARIEDVVKNEPELITRDVARGLYEHYQLLAPHSDTANFLHTRRFDANEVLAQLKIPVPPPFPAGSATPAPTYVFKIEDLSYEQVIAITEEQYADAIPARKAELRAYAKKLSISNPRAHFNVADNDKSFYLRYLSAEQIDNLSDKDLDAVVTHWAELAGSKVPAVAADPDFRLSSLQAAALLSFLQKSLEHTRVDPALPIIPPKINAIATRCPELYQEQLKINLKSPAEITRDDIEVGKAEGCPLSVQGLSTLVQDVAMDPRLELNATVAFRALNPHNFSEAQRVKFENKLMESGLDVFLYACLTPEQIDYLIATRRWNPAALGIADTDVPHWTQQQKEWLAEQARSAAELDDEAKINALDASGLPKITKQQLRDLSIPQLQQLKSSTISKMNVAQLTGLALNSHLTPNAAGAVHRLNVEHRRALRQRLGESLQAGCISIREAGELAGDAGPSVIMHDDHFESLRDQVKAQSLEVYEVKERLDDRMGRFKPLDPVHLSLQQIQGLSVFDYVEANRKNRLFHRAKYLAERDERPEFTGSMTSLMALCMKPAHVHRLEDEQLRVLMGVWGQAHRRDPAFRIGETQTTALIERLGRCQIERDLQFLELMQSVAAMVPEKQAELMALSKAAAGRIADDLAQITPADVTVTDAKGKCVLSVKQLRDVWGNMNHNPAAFQASDPNTMTAEQQQVFCEIIDSNLDLHGDQSIALPLLTDQQVEFLVASRQLSPGSAKALLNHLTAQMKAIPPGLELQSIDPTDATAADALDKTGINQTNKAGEPELSAEQLEGLPAEKVALLDAKLVAKMNAVQLIALRKNTEIDSAADPVPAAPGPAASAADMQTYRLACLKAEAVTQLAERIQKGELTATQLSLLPAGMRATANTSSMAIDAIRTALQDPAAHADFGPQHLSYEQLNQLTVRDYVQAHADSIRPLLDRAKELADAADADQEIKPTSLMALFLSVDRIEKLDKINLQSVTSTWAQAQRAGVPAGWLTADRQQAFLEQHRKQMQGQSSLALYHALGQPLGKPLVDTITPTKIILLSNEELTASLHFWATHQVTLTDEQQTALAKKIKHSDISRADELSKLNGLGADLQVLQKPVANLAADDLHAADGCRLSLSQIEDLVANYDSKPNELQALDPELMSPVQLETFMGIAQDGICSGTNSSGLHLELTQKQVMALAYSRCLEPGEAVRLYNHAPAVDKESALGKLLEKQILAGPVLGDLLPHKVNEMARLGEDGPIVPVLTHHQFSRLGQKACEGIKLDTISRMNGAQLVGLAGNTYMPDRTNPALDLQREEIEKRAVKLMKLGQLTMAEAGRLYREPVIRGRDLHSFLYTPTLNPIQVQRRLSGRVSDPNFDHRELSLAQLELVDWTQVPEDKQDDLNKRYRYVSHAATIEDAKLRGKVGVLDDEGDVDEHGDFRRAVLRIAEGEGYKTIQEFIEESGNQAVLERLMQPRCALQIHRICLAVDREEGKKTTYYQKLREILCNPTIQFSDLSDDDKKQLIDRLEVSADSDVAKAADLITKLLPDLNQQAFLSIPNKSELYVTLGILEEAGLTPKDISFDSDGEQKDKCMVNLAALLRGYKLSDDGKDLAARDPHEGDNLTTGEVVKYCRELAQKIKTDADLKKKVLEKAKKNSDQLSLIIESARIKQAKEAYEKSLKEDRENTGKELQQQESAEKRLRDSIQPAPFNAMRATSVNMQDPGDMTAWVEEMLNWLFGMVEGFSGMHKADNRGRTVRALRRIKKKLDAEPNMSKNDREHLRLIYECHKARFLPNLDARNMEIPIKKRQLEAFYRETHGGKLPANPRDLYRVGGTYIGGAALNWVGTPRIRPKPDPKTDVQKARIQQSKAELVESKNTGGDRCAKFVAQDLDQLWRAIKGEEEQLGEGKGQGLIAELIPALKEDLIALAKDDGTQISDLHKKLGEHIKAMESAMEKYVKKKPKSDEKPDEKPDEKSDNAKYHAWVGPVQRVLKRMKSLQPYCAPIKKKFLEDIMDSGKAPCYVDMRGPTPASSSATIHGGAGVPAPTGTTPPKKKRRTDGPRSGW